MAQIPLNFCPTGMVPTKAMNPHVPLSPAEIVEQVHEAWEIGITIAHVHARSADGSPSPDPEIYGRILEGIRRHCPALVVCVSTSGRGGITLERRLAVLELRPDMGSLTLGSLNFPREASINSPEAIMDLATRMRDLCVTPEFECFDLGMINYGRYLIEKTGLSGPFYWNLLFGNLTGFQPSPASIGCALAEIPEGHHVAFGGIGEAQLPANAVAVALGRGVRLGLEDNLWWDANRTRLATNRELLQRVHELIRLQGHVPMPAQTFGELGFYNAKRLPRV